MGGEKLEEMLRIAAQRVETLALAHKVQPKHLCVQVCLAGLFHPGVEAVGLCVCLLTDQLVDTNQLFK